MKSLSCVQLFAMPWTVAYNAPLSMGLSRQEYWSGLPFLLHRIFPTQGSNLGLLHCRQMLCHLSHQGSPRIEKKRIVLLQDTIHLSLPLCNMGITIVIPGTGENKSNMHRVLKIVQNKSFKLSAVNILKFSTASRSVIFFSKLSTYFPD